MSKLSILPHSLELTVEEKSLGAFSNISIDDYHGEQLAYAFSKSDLDACEISPANMIQKRNGPMSDSDALRMGRALHLRLEFHNDQASYEEFVAVVPKVDARTKEGKAIKEAFTKDNFKKLILTADESDEIEAMLLAVNSNPESASFLKYSGINEETLIWQDADSKVIVKARPDRRLTEAPRGLPNHLVIDWKTIASPQDGDIIQAAFKSVTNRRYQVQAAIQLDGLKACHGIDGTFINVFIEKGGQGRVICAVMEDQDVEIGRAAYKKNLQTIAECQRTNIWSGLVKLYDKWGRS